MPIREYWGQQRRKCPSVGTGVMCQGNEQPVGDNAEGMGRGGGEAGWSLRNHQWGGSVFFSHSRVSLTCR